MVAKKNLWCKHEIRNTQVLRYICRRSKQWKRSIVSFAIVLFKISFFILTFHKILNEIELAFSWLKSIHFRLIKSISVNHVILIVISSFKSFNWWIPKACEWKKMFEWKTVQEKCISDKKEIEIFWHAFIDRITNHKSHTHTKRKRLSAWMSEHKSRTWWRNIRGNIAISTTVRKLKLTTIKQRGNNSSLTLTHRTKWNETYTFAKVQHILWRIYNPFQYVTFTWTETNYYKSHRKWDVDFPVGFL